MRWFRNENKAFVGLRLIATIGEQEVRLFGPLVRWGIGGGDYVRGARDSERGSFGRFGRSWVGCGLLFLASLRA